MADTPFDPYAYDPGTTAANGGGFDPYAYDPASAEPASVSAKKSAPVEMSNAQAFKGAVDILHVLGAHAVIDPLAAAARTITRGVDLLPGEDAPITTGDITSAQQWLDKRLGSPLTSEGQAGLEAVGNVVKPIMHGLHEGAAAVVGEENVPVVSDIAQSLPAVGMLPNIGKAAKTAAASAATIGRAATAPVRWWESMVARGQPSASEIMEHAAQESPQSMGAASSGISMAQTSPEFQQEVQSVFRRQGAVNPGATARQAEAESIGTHLTEGQALQDADRMSNELNGRARNPEVRQFIGQQNEDLKNYQQRLRDEIADNNGVHASNQVDHGEAFIQGYNDLNDAERGVIDTKYQTLRDAYAKYLEGGGKEMAIDAGTLLDRVQKALKTGVVDPQTGQRLGGMLTNHANPGIMRDLQDAAESGGMSFEDYEALRTNLATLMRSSTNPLERASSHVIRSAMEDMPLAQDIQQLKGLADDARASARTYFQRVEADPAWKAVIDGTVTPDKFTKSFITGANATRQGVSTMLQNFADNPTMRAQMTTAALDHIREASGIDAQGNGVFHQSGFNKALNVLDPKANSLFSPAMREGLQRLGNVARNMQRRLPGSYVNESNTWTAAAGEFARHGAEALLNAKTGGLASIPFSAFREASRAREATRIIRPGAGIDVLEEPKPWVPERPLEPGVQQPPRPTPTVASGGQP